MCHIRVCIVWYCCDWVRWIFCKIWNVWVDSSYGNYVLRFNVEESYPTAVFPVCLAEEFLKVQIEVTMTNHTFEQRWLVTGPPH